MRVNLQIVEREEGVSCQVLAEGVEQAPELCQLFLSHLIDYIKSDDLRAKLQAQRTVVMGERTLHGYTHASSSQEGLRPEADGITVLNLFDPPVLEILGMPNALVMLMANAMRRKGMPVLLHRPAERAMVVSWCLRRYSEYGPKWHDHVIEELG